MDPCRPNWPYTLERDSLQARGLRWWWPGPELLNAGAVRCREMLRGAHLTMSSPGADEGRHPALGRCWRFGSGLMSRMSVSLVGSTGPQAISVWIVPTAAAVASSQKIILDSYSANGVRIELRSGTVRAYMSTTGSAWGVGADSQSAVVADRPYHLGLVLAQGQYSLHLNGRWQNSIGTGNVAINQDGYTFADYRSGGYLFDGLIADLRVYWGEDAVGVDATYSRLMRHLYDPRTRWELYAKPSRRLVLSVGEPTVNSTRVRRPLHGRAGARRG